MAKDFLGFKYEMSKKYDMPSRDGTLRDLRVVRGGVWGVSDWIAGALTSWMDSPIGGFIATELLGGGA